MNLRIIIAILLMAVPRLAHGQSIKAYADSVRRQYHIPELAFAVVSADTVLAMENLGVRKVGTDLAASAADRFRIGSNTKAVTGMVAALLVKEHKITWNTRFFDLFPELKKQSNKAYYGLTLVDLLSFRGNVMKWTYTNATPVSGQFHGDYNAQRQQFAAWVLQQQPNNPGSGLNFSNPGYLLAGLMLERASGSTYKELVQDLSRRTGISFGFGNPNATDSLQTWGHGNGFIPEPRTDNYKLEWLLAAGNINITLPDYAKFIQLQLQGLQGRSALLGKEEIQFLHYGRKDFSIGWFADTTDDGRRYSWSEGNPGTFLSKAYIYNDHNVAFIILANAQNDSTTEGMNVLFEELKRRW